jgi:hypothetical protein
MVDFEKVDNRLFIRLLHNLDLFENLMKENQYLVLIYGLRLLKRVK